MKNKLILSITFIIIFSIFWNERNMVHKINSIKIAYSFYDSIESLDPANIQDIYQANLIENLYSRLVEYNNDGELECDLCSNFEIQDQFIIFEFRENIKTIDSKLITAEDASYSLKRLFRLNTNTHGNLSFFVENIKDIYTENKKLLIKLKKKEYSQFVIPLLTSMDFSIIPIDSIKNDKIIDFKNTSGAYYFEQIIDKNLILKSNKNNHHYSEEMPQSILLKQISNKDAIDSFLKNEIDVIDITMYPRSHFYKELFMQKNKKFNYIKTIPMNLLYIGISKNAQHNFSQSEIFNACEIINKVYKSFDTFGYEYRDTYEFFQRSGNGQLNESKLTKLINLRKQNNLNNNLTQITLGVLEQSFEKVKIAFKDYKSIKIISFKTDPATLRESERPDLFLQTTDSSFTEDFNTISYNVSSGNFGLTSEQGDNWIQNYINTEDKNSRVEQLQKLQENFLNKPDICPLVVSPYWAISNENLNLNFPTLYPGSHWWKIRIQ